MMSLAEIHELSMAVLTNDGRSVCAECAPFVGGKAPYIRNWNAAPVLKVDEGTPLVSSCPECEHKYQTPVAVAMFALLERIKRLEGAS